MSWYRAGVVAWVRVWDGRALRIVRPFIVRFIRDDVLGLSGELAYRFFLTIVPFFIFLASVGNPLAAILGWPNPAEQVAYLMGRVMPPDAASVFQQEIQHVIQTTRPGVLPLSLVGSLLAATSGTNAVIKAANRAYGVEETRPFWQRYLTALGLTVLAGLALVGAFTLYIAGLLFGSQLASSLGVEPGFQVIVEVAFRPMVAILLIAGISVLHWAAPNIRLRFRWVIPGALVSTVGWVISTGLFARYVAQIGSYGLTYGALAGVAILLLWFYLTAFLLLVGLEVSAGIGEMVHATEIRERQRSTRAEAAVRVLPPSSAGRMASSPPD